MAIEVISTIKPKNNGNFPLVEAKDIAVDENGTRLDEKLSNLAVATSIDLSGYESNGQIAETYADGTTKTTTVEFDASGNPTKITDGDGNVTTLTW